jgi:PAS domain S-box-containing protein
MVTGSANNTLDLGERRFRHLMDSAPVMIWASGPDKLCNYFNQPWLSFTGRTFQQELGDGWADGVHQEDLDRCLEIYVSHFDRREPFRMEYRLRRADGEYRWILDSGAPRYSKDGSFAGFIGSCIDITERKRAEDSLRASEARWRSIFEHSVVGIGTIDRDKRYLSANPALQKMLGYSEEELRGLTLAAVIHPEERDATDLGLDAVWEGRQESYRIEKRMIRKDGSVIWVNITGAPVPATERDPAFFPTVVVNVTDQKKAEEALRVSRTELARVSRLTTMGELTASIAHEVNQPLAAIVVAGNACRRWLASDEPNLGRARDSVDRMIRDAHRASEIITRIRSMTKNTPPVQLAVDINGVIADVLSFTRGELLAKAVSVRLALFEGLSTVIGDRVQLQQVVLNLVMNAIEAMSSTIDRERVLAIISQRGDDGSPIVTVEDSGLGLDPTNRDRIFDPFFTTKPSGMGMGLSISTSIVEGHGGFLWASPNLPRGAAFHLKLPIGRETKAHSDKTELVSADFAACIPAEIGSTGICGGTQL